MKLRTSFLTRCVAFALALVLAASAVNVGAVAQVFAADSNETSVTAGVLVANNYELTDAEKALLNSGLLVGDSYGYSIPSDGEALVAVDTDNAKITASKYENWVPTTAYIVAGGEIVETITLADGKGTYDPAVGNAFAVKVDYVLNISVPEATQTTLLNASADLTQGLANLAAGYAADTDLGTVVLAMDTLVMLANGITMDFGYFQMSASFETAAAVAAVKELKAQVTANNGLLNLQVVNNAYNNSPSKVQYLVENGAAYKAELTTTYEALAAIKNDPLANNTLLDNYLKGSDPASYTKWMAFKSILNNLVAALEPVANDPWTANGKTIVKSGLTVADYAKLDTLLANVTTVTAAPAVKNPLKVADASVQKNLSMFNVTVNVSLEVVEDKADSANLVTYGADSVMLTLAANATAEEIQTEIDASGIVAKAQAAWGEAYIQEHYAPVATVLPGTLTEDITYTVTYKPVEYTVSYGYATDAPTSVPYGYQITLPVNEDAAKAYDYTVNGTGYAQGEVYTVVGNTEINRTSGKAYANTDLYTVVSNNYGNDLTKAILQSGALKGNTVISVRKPDPADAQSLLTLVDGTLTGKNYVAAYEGLNWVPYTYGVEGTENSFNGSTASWDGKSVKVQYILNLTNFSDEEVAEVLALAVALKAEADEQKNTLDRLNAYYDTIGLLDKTKLGALNGVIDVTDFTPGDGTDADQANLEMREYFKGLVGGIIANNLDSNNQLKIYNMLTQYRAEGLRYYYHNSAAVIAEIDSLSGYLSGMLADDEKLAALEIMVGAAGYPEYAEKIVNLESVMTSVKAALTAPNAAIDLESENLGKLLDALTSTGKVENQPAAAPYLISDALTALDESTVMVQVIITTPAGSATVTTEGMARGTELSREVADKLEKDVNDKVIGLLGDATHYDVTVSKSLDSLVGTAIDANINVYYEYTAKTYTVMIDGEADQTVSVNDLEINLPKHPTSGWTYEYTVDGVAGIKTTTYTFTLEQLTRLFADGSYTITRTEINEADTKLESVFADWLVKDADGNVIGLHAAVSGDKDGIMGFAMTLVNSGYTYIGLNGEPLLYLNEENTLEICLQTLVNAILHDNTFGSQTLVALGENGEGALVNATMQLGNAADDIHFNDLDFVLYLTSVPGAMGTVSNGLSKFENYMTFQSQDGTLVVDLNLPEKVYEVYLTALLATGEVDKDDINAVNSEIAFQFLWDYVDLILSTDADTQTYTNTLAMLGKSIDLTGYEKYYSMVKTALTDEGVQINPDENGIFDMIIAAKGQKAINGLIDFTGMDTSAYDTYLGMIKEYKSEDAELTIAINANLENTDTNYEALVLDLNASGIQNKFDYTTDLPARAGSIADKAAVILLDDVDGNLIFNGTTILDLNGKTVNGSITSNGTLYIVDSYLDAAEGGHVTGIVSGNVTVIAGKYDADVTAFLKDGFKQENGVVRNALYILESDGTNVTIVINTDVMSDESVDGYIPNARALAVDVAVELVMNYITSAALSAEGNVIYDINVDDLIGLLAGSNKADALINKALNSVDVPGISAFANVILADLLDFAAIETAIANNEAVTTYTLTTAPWAVSVEHKSEGDYITFGICSNPDNAESFTVSLKLEGENKAYAEKFFGALADTVVAEAKVDLKQPEFDGANNAFTVVGSATANVNVDLTVDDNYLTVVTVILANGNPANKADLIAALNSGNQVALKDAIDALTVADVITALKAVNRNTSFTAMASKLGVTVDVAEAAELESIFHLVLCASGKALDILEIAGTSTKLGSMDADDDGIYEWSTTATRNPDASAAGYTVYAEASVDVSLSVKLFDACLWGDANHDGEVNGMDATLVLQYYAGAIGADDLCLKRTDVNGDGDHNGMDATLILQYYAGVIEKFPAEN